MGVTRNVENDMRVTRKLESDASLWNLQKWSNRAHFVTSGYVTHGLCGVGADNFHLRTDCRKSAGCQGSCVAIQSKVLFYSGPAVLSITPGPVRSPK